MRSAALAVCAGLLAASAGAAALSVSATLNGARAALGEQLVLSVSISGSGTAAPKPPLIPDVEIYESGKSQSMSIVNGSVSSNVVYTYVLAPRKAGRFVVPAIEVPGAAPTAPIEFTVAAAAAPPTAAPAVAPAQPAQAPGGTRSPDVFVTATLDKNRAYVNEQVTLTVRFYTAIALMGAPQYEPPKLTGLLAENISGENQGATVIGGRSFHYSELKTALFPVQAGRASIGPAAVTIQLMRRGASTGDDFFDRFFSGAAPEARRLQTDPLTLQADALPPGAPDDFSGIVGSLNVETSADRARLKAGEAMNMTTTVSGVGNIKSLPEPKRPDLPSVRYFESESTVKLDRVGGDRIGGSKIFKTVVVPRVSGPLDVPGASVSFFDPAKKAYGRAQAKPVRITVLPGDPNAALPVVGSSAGPGAAPGVTEVAADIRYLKTPGGRSIIGDALAAFGATGPWHALPFAFFLVAAIMNLTRRRAAANPRERRSAAASSAAERTLRRAEETPGHLRPAAVALLGEALAGYFADKFDQPQASLSLKAVVHRLTNSRKQPNLAALGRLKAVWDELDLLRYSPDGAGQAEVKRLADEIRDLTAVYDLELRP